MKMDQKGPETVWRVVNSLKNQQKWPKLGLKNTEWPLKDSFVYQCSQSFTSQDKSSEYLARFYTFELIGQALTG